ncbi:c-type cytochrome [Azospirillum thermophilum]|uniref:Cytochrome c domain-containing protein n=1 Tax=Azospirillum thermophilum TaxID=2202148 RepID=A0A2S2CWB0_9PROT|nr:cytochrome c [Azospirillum thermophilum]AWK88690.1 hypothetical protein DEW08_21555 [Azospirillum thermophilum]
MRRRRNMTGLVLAASLSAVPLLGAAAAPDGPGTPAFGRRLAKEACSECHIVAPDQEDEGKWPAPNLMDRMRNPAITEMALRSYLQTSHPIMPNIRLSPEQTDDIVAYLLTFKEATR